MITAIHLFQGPIAQALTHALGWTLLHFVWQGTLVAVVLCCALALMERRSADARYAAASLALLAMVALPLLTFAHLANEEYRATFAQAAFVDAGSIVIRAGVDARPASWSARLTFVLDRNMPWLMLLWCAGVLVFSCRLAVGMLVAHGWKLEGIQSAPARLQSVFDRLRVRLGVRRAAQLVESARVHVPTVIGWLKPVVLLPAGCLVGMSEQQVEALLAHELAHICRNDYLVSVVQSVVEAVLFYHPAVWWVSRQVRREREYCCDEMAVGVCGDRVAYARALSLLEERRALLPEVVLGANGGVLTMRIKRLLGYREEMASSNMAWVIVLVIVIAGGGSIIGRFALAESKPAVTAVEPMEQTGQTAQAAAQAAIGETEKNAAEVESRIDKAAEQSQEAQKQLDQAQQNLAQATEDTAASEAARKQIEDAQKRMQAALEKLNSAEFKARMAAAQGQMKKLSSPEFRKQMEDATAAAAKTNTPEFRKQMEDVQKRLQDSQELLQKMQARFNSPEFRKQMEDAEKQLQGSQRRIQAKLNSPEFRKQMEDAQKKAEKFDTPEFRKKMEELRKQAEQFNTPEFKQKMKRLADEANAKQSQAKERRAKMMASSAEAANGALPPQPPPPPSDVASPAPNGPVRVSSGVAQSQAILQVQPVYPPEAREARIQGTVVLKAVISKDGTVEKLSVVSGPKELMKSAIDAVSQWKYKPYLLNGQPVEVETTINVNYTFGEGSGPGPGPQAGNYTPPQIIYKVEPEFTPETKAAKVAGVVVVNMDVTPQGLPDNVHVVRSLNPALDRKAVEAVSQYRFKPATREGVPVTVPVNVEVNFQVR